MVSGFSGFGAYAFESVSGPSKLNTKPSRVEAAGASF